MVPLKGFIDETVTVKFLSGRTHSCYLRGPEDFVVCRSLSCMTIVWGYLVIICMRLYAIPRNTFYARLARVAADSYLRSVLARRKPEFGISKRA